MVNLKCVKFLLSLRACMTADNFCRQGKTDCIEYQSDHICAPHQIFQSRTVKTRLKCIFSHTHKK